MCSNCNIFVWSKFSDVFLFIFSAGNSAFETADSIMGATNLIHMFARSVDNFLLFVLSSGKKRAK